MKLLDEQLIPLIPQGLAVAIYTRTTDEDIEINGYLTYDRQVEKMDDATLCAAHERIYRAFKRSFGAG